MSGHWPTSPGGTPPGAPLGRPRPAPAAGSPWTPAGAPSTSAAPHGPGAGGPGGASPTPAPPDGGRPSADARNALVIAGVVVALLLAFAFAFTWLVSRDASEASAPTTAPSTVPSTPPSSAPSTPPTTPPTTAPPPPADAAPIPELQEFVSAHRGLPFTADVPVALLDDDEYASQLLASFAPGALEQMLWELQILGLVGTGPEALEELEELLTASIDGHYHAGQVFVHADARSPQVDATIVHELTHALDDQHFDLERPDLAEATDESRFGLSAVIEGSALETAAAYAEAQGLPSESFDGVDPSLGLLVMPHYVFAEAYVRSLLDAGGSARLDEAFRTPPTTSKEVMEERYHLEGYTPVPVEPPPAPAEVIDEGLFGEVRFWQIFTQVADQQVARDLASTWRGDWYVVWVDGLEQCLRVDVELVSPQAAATFAEGLRVWSVSQPHAVVEELSSGLVRLTVCAPRPPPPPGTVSPA